MSNEAAFYSYDNFILGSTSPASVFAQSQCCHLSITVNIEDMAGNNQVCQLKSVAEDKARALLSTAGIAAIVTIVVLLIAIGIAVGVILFIRHKRSVDLEEMRVTHS